MLAQLIGLVYLRNEVARTNDWARYQMWKIRHIESVIKKVLSCGYFLSGDIDQIRNIVESKKRYTNWDEYFIDKTSFSKPFIADYRELIHDIVIGSKLCIKSVSEKIGVLKIK